PPSPPAPSPCNVCVTITINPPTDFSGNPYSFGPNVSCSALSSLITNGLTTTAADYGVVISTPFTMKSCSTAYDPIAQPRVTPTMQVCGGFYSAVESQKLQLDVGELLKGWVQFVVGSAQCPAYLDGYIVDGFVQPDDGSSCLVGEYVNSCSSKAFPLPPPPPSPPTAPATPPPPFSFVQTHICPQSNANVPYILSPIQVSKGRDLQGNAATVMCTSVVTQTCDPSASCCDMDFSKVELLLNTGCKGDLRRTTINGKDVSTSWQTYTGFTALKFTNLLTLLSNPTDATICWYIRNGACSTPSAFCYNGSCQADVFSSDNKCCPANLI
ncbi:hypothetical protein Agub_g11471, partial [Astrephomene gubernaculifera]